MEKSIVNLGKCIVLESGNLMVCKDNFFFFMTSKGKHLNKFERAHKKLHGSQKWTELKHQVGEVHFLTQEQSALALAIIKSFLKPLELESVSHAVASH